MLNKAQKIKFLILLLLAFASVSCRDSRQSSSTIPKAKNKRPSAKAQKVISAARSYIGTRYKYGGETRTGMDCSGLMLTVFKSVNINLPRTSAKQSVFGKKVSLKELKCGDLVFFTDKKGHKKVTHVGIISQKEAGSIKFIHASTKSGVVESDLYAPYYISIFLFGGRVLN